jgi:hypothetical protein
MPPASTGAYEPPSVESNTEPASDDVQVESTEEDKPKKKSFMDEDDEEDLAARAAAIQKAERARRDREADEAFRKAAEADGKFPCNCRSLLWLIDLSSQETPARNREDGMVQWMVWRQERRQ